MRGNISAPPPPIRIRVLLIFTMYKSDKQRFTSPSKLKKAKQNKTLLYSKWPLGDVQSGLTGLNKLLEKSLKMRMKSMKPRILIKFYLDGWIRKDYSCT